jgi:hypothetical protein
MYSLNYRAASLLVALQTEWWRIFTGAVAPIFRNRWLSSERICSGLLICAECGANYRRITRDSGEVVWRCANRVNTVKKYASIPRKSGKRHHGHYLCEEHQIFAILFLKVTLY